MAQLSTEGLQGQVNGRKLSICLRATNKTPINLLPREIIGPQKAWTKAAYIMFSSLFVIHFDV